MANYDKNFQVLMGGHLNLIDDNGNVKMANNIPAKNDATNTADVRQILTNIVGRGYKSLSDDNIRADFAQLSNLVGLTQARKLVDHAVIYNQNPVNMKLPTEAKVQGFFNAPVSDATIKPIIEGAARFGDGVIAGMNRSANIGNQQLSGNYDAIEDANNDIAEIQALANKKIK